MYHQAQTNFHQSLKQKLQDKHTAYMRALMHRLKEIRQAEGIAAAYLCVSLHELEGDSLLSAKDFELLKQYVVEEKWHQQDSVKAN